MLLANPTAVSSLNCDPGNSLRWRLQSLANYHTERYEIDKNRY